jgi:hypothetical protein
MWDKRGENLTYRWLKRLSEQQNLGNVLIAGDSQSGGIGRSLEAKLKSAGYNVVRITRSGRDTAAILSAIKKINPNEFDVAYIFAGGSRTYSPNPDKPVNVNTAAIKNMLNFLSGVKRVIWVGPPPATKITNLPTTKKIFGDKVTNEDFWISTGTARRREEKNEIIKGIVDDAGRVFYDVRNLLSPFPDQSDGIHVAGSARTAVASDLVKYSTGIDAARRGAPSAAGLKKAPRSFSGKRLSTSELRSMTAEQVVEYAKSRSSVCRNMGYLSINSKGKPVADLQNSLKQKGYEIKDAEGEFGENTLISVIKSQIKAGIRVDGCVGPKTLKALGVEKQPATAQPASDADYVSSKVEMEEKQFAEKHGLDPNILGAFVTMESGGRGFVPSDPKNPDSPKRMLIRFEPHVFVRLLIRKGVDPDTIPFYVAPPKNDEEAETLARRFNLPANKLKKLIGMPLRRAIKYAVWSKMQRINASRTGFRRSGSGIARLNYREWDGLNNALKLDKDAAYKSISMGTGQVMGFNYRRLGYSSPEEMFNALNNYSEEGKQKQKQAKLKFIESSPRLMRAIREKEWEMIGALYNGSKQYGRKLQKVYNRMVA